MNWSDVVAYFESLEWDKQSDGGEEGHGEKKKQRSKRKKEKKPHETKFEILTPE